MKDDKYLMSSLSNALLVLDILALHDRVGVAELSKLSGLGKASLFKMLYTLEKRGYVYKTREARYGLSFKFAQYGQSVVERFDLVSLARPFLRQLSQNLGEAVHLAILSADGFKVIFIDKEVVTNTIRMSSRVGLEIPSHCTATGKALLASLDETRLTRIMEAIDYRRLTPHTITSPDLLMKELQCIRAEGFARDKEESEEGLICLGAAIKDVSGQAAGAVSVSGPKSRMNKNSDKYLKALLETVGLISKNLGN